MKWDSNFPLQLTWVIVALRPYEPNIKRRNRPPPVQVTRNILSMKQYDVLSVQKEKSKVEIEKIKLESIKLSDRY